jgi:CubicO group peptidase (beta-lactamase class C family)
VVLNVNKINKILQELEDTGVMPGISILVGKKGENRLEIRRGCKSVVPRKQDIDKDTLYDMASLTKPLVTAFLTVYLSEKERIPLDTPVKKILPCVPFDFTILQLSTHTSGLPAWHPFYLFGDDYLSCFQSLNLKSRPGKRVAYSCPGYILLRYIIEKVSGLPFAVLARETLFEPLGLENTFLYVPEILKSDAAPTEKGNRYERNMALDWAKKSKNTVYMDMVKGYKWRRYMIRGETHDVNSHHLGGTAGNAGLFSTTGDVFRLSREFFPSTATILKPGSIRLFWENFTPFTRNHRTVGFKRNSSHPTSGGSALSESAIGHTGFTGVSLWLDPRDETVFVVLSNRIHPVFKPYNFDKVRRRIHRALSKEEVAL